jgi:uncharacterized membrane protein YagU involved in acid resistance
MVINYQSWALWGFGGTVVLSILLEASQGLKLTRMNFPYLLGTIFTPHRDRARAIGLLVHIFNGLLFSLIYVAVFQSFGRATWWIGSMLGLIHALFLLVVVMALMPGLHPRMATEQTGPEARRVLEPPGFLALNYGVQTPLSVVVSHVIFGCVLGAFYQLA